MTYQYIISVELIEVRFNEPFGGGQSHTHTQVARQGGLGGAQMATTVRNLRIREDR